ncbi:hypothetical protein K469DRAFT_695834 [Zopfia rhizophila CBS 207.26]|uniref:Uncharacterized protein n=1 Tax=Zopfia rhizophila CBS 207.26 TaxID=1314779 RepID=A0A6A6ELP6_9PEZI|nr:hypothetical protein K469DRAFT_695834 [Zopfia rhizophila CBS 207.26]
MAHQLKSSLVVTFPIGIRHSLPVPPSGVVATLNGLTGWTLRYFAIIDKFRSKNKRLGSKKYGRADIMLWEKEVEDASGKRRGTQVTFRHHDESDKIWTSGASKRFHGLLRHRCVLTYHV